MKIVVVGGTGLIGSKTVERLREKGHDVVAASPRSGVDTITGEGLAGALAGAQVVIAHGRVIAEGTPDTFARGAEQAALVAFRVPYGVADDDLPLPDGVAIERRGRHVSFRTHTPTRDLAPLLGWAAANGIELEALSVTRPSLEDVYLQLTEEPA